MLLSDQDAAAFSSGVGAVPLTVFTGEGGAQGRTERTPATEEELLDRGVWLLARQLRGDSFAFHLRRF